MLGWTSKMIVLHKLYSFIIATKNHQNITVVGCILFIITLYQILSNGFVEGGRDSIIKNKESKTIVSEDGDIFDCVDIYEQPAFSHPLLKNHTIQMKPSTSAGKLEARSSDVGLFQSWHKNEQCPDGTIPIIRTKFPSKHLANYKFIANETNPNQNLPVNSYGHEFAIVDMGRGIYHGAKAKLNVWSPKVAYIGELSLAQMWLSAGEDNDLNTVESGWLVTSADVKTRLFIYWTRDGYQSTGCYNLECPGFVQINKNIGLGSTISPISMYNGQQYHITISIHKEPSGNWWLNVHDAPVGYWPASILTALTKGATGINLGGKVVNLKPDGHSSTEMGNGHFANEGLGKSAFVANLGYYDTTGAIKDPDNVYPIATNPACYNVEVPEDRGGPYGVYFLYGGSGLSPQCP